MGKRKKRNIWNEDETFDNVMFVPDFKIYRFMSRDEFEKLMRGEVLANKTNHSDFAITNSVGFCFLGENNYFPDGSSWPPHFCYDFLGGIVSEDVFVEFECKTTVKSGFGRYRTPLIHLNKSNYFNLNEFSTTEYSRRTMIPTRFSMAKYGYDSANLTVFSAKEYEPNSFTKYKEIAYNCRDFLEIFSPDNAAAGFSYDCFLRNKNKDLSLAEIEDDLRGRGISTESYEYIMSRWYKYEAVYGTPKSEILKIQERDYDRIAVHGELRSRVENELWHTIVRHPRYNTRRELTKRAPGVARCISNGG